MTCLRPQSKSVSELKSELKSFCLQSIDNTSLWHLANTYIKPRRSWKWQLKLLAVIWLHNAWSCVSCFCWVLWLGFSSSVNKKWIKHEDSSDSSCRTTPHCIAAKELKRSSKYLLLNVKLSDCSKELFGDWFLLKSTKVRGHWTQSNGGYIHK